MSLTRIILCGTLVCGIASNAPLGQAAPPDPATAASQVDQLLRKELSSQGTASPVAKVNDETFLRRVTLDLIGQNPHAEEIILFSLDSDPAKRVREVDRLLADKRYGENWGRYWRDVIFFRRTEDRALFGATSCTDYLAEQFNKNTAWDKIATELITAVGDVSENGATGLILAQGGQPEETVAEVSRIFMGIQIQCAQCHDHPTDRWKREQFHELAAFFPRVALQRDLQSTPPIFRVSVNDREFNFRTGPNNNQRRRGTAEHRMPDKDNPSAQGTVMSPVFFVTGQSLRTGMKDADRRGTFATWLTAKENEWFAKALVNRLWSELVGEGFYEPMDDLGPDRQCSAPETMNYLATSFYDSGYDLKWLFQTIAGTEAYQMVSRSRRNPESVPFQANVNQRLRGDALFANVLHVLAIDEQRLPAGGRGPGGIRNAGRTPRGQFNSAFGYDPSTHREEVVGSIPQALLLMNTPFINQGIDSRRGSLSRLLSELKNDDEVTVELYLRTLAREPTAKELEICQSHLKEVGNRGEAFEDIQWSLINSAEFLHRR